MILCIDCGNTRLKWGLLDDKGWQARGYLAHADAAQLANLCEQHGPVETICACNVAGSELAAQIEAALPAPVRWITAQPAQCGVINRYLQPEQLGADRWAALIGAHKQHAGAALVVNAGTATTIDSLDADGIFLGGMILPGLSLMRAALFRNTAQLPLASAHYADFPRQTDVAIASGALEATLGAIERSHRRLRHSTCDEVLCLLSGGAAGELAPLLKIPTFYVESLVLEGIAVIAQNTNTP